MSNIHPMNSRPGPIKGPIADTLINLLSGLGTAKDKTTQTRFTMQLLDKSQLMSAYRGDWIARKIINAPADDSTREWRAWQAEKKDITELEKAEKDLRLQLKVKQAMQRARLLGGAALVMGVDQGSADKELVVERVKRGQLKYVHVLNRDEITPDALIQDVTSEYYGEPESYVVNSANRGMVKIHPSRVIRFIGNEIPDINIANDGWGDSVLQTIYDAVIQAGQTTANVASIVHEAKIDVVKIPDMMNQIGTSEYRGRLLERFTLANSMKSLVNTLILDKEEEWNRITASFAGLPDLIRVYLLIASGAADIPATRMLGQSASGFNATGTEDTRNYYDRLSSDQRNDTTPRLDRFDEVMVRSVFGDKPDEVTYTWNSLWQLSDQESAEVAAKKAQIFTADVNAGLLPPEVLREARENQLIEDEVYPGLEQAIDQYGEQNLDEYNQAVVAQMSARAALAAPENPDDPEGTAKAKKKAITSELQRRKALPPPRPPAARSQDSWVDRHLVSRGDARYTPTLDETTPRSLYVRRDVLNGEEILAHFEEQGVDVSGTDPDDMHVTILYSRQPVDWIKMGEAYYGVSSSGDEEDVEYDYDMCVRAGGPRVMEAFGVPPDTLVMCFASSQLCYRHQHMVLQGASEDYEDYNPHVSIASWDGIDPRDVVPWQGEIYLGPEIFEPIKRNREGAKGGEAYDWRQDVDDYRPDQLRGKGGRWAREAGGGAGGKSGRGKGAPKSKAGAKVQRLSSKAMRATRKEAPLGEKALAKAVQSQTFARRLNEAGTERKDFEKVMKDLEASKLTKTQLVDVLRSYKLTASMIYTARESRSKLLGRFRSDFTQMKRFENKTGLPASKWGWTKGWDSADEERYEQFVADYSPDQPREPAGSGRGGQFSTIVGSGLSEHTGAAGMNVQLLKSRRLESGKSFEVDLTKRAHSGLLKPMSVEVAREFKVGSKWRKNPDQAGDYAAGIGYMLAKQFPGLARFAEQFWYDAAANMTPKEYDYAKSYFATRDGAFSEGYRAAFSPNGKAFGLSRARTSEVFGRSVGQLRTSVGSAISGGSGTPAAREGFFSRMGNKLSNMIGAP